MAIVKRCFVLVLFISSILGILKASELYWPLGNDENVSFELAEIVLSITQTHLVYLTSTIVIVERSTCPETINTNIILLEYILQQTKEQIAVQLHVSTEDQKPWDYYILIVDSNDAFRLIYDSFLETYHERHYHFLIILTKYTKIFVNTMEEIFELCYQFNVIDVNIIVEHPIEGVCMYTYNLYSENACRTIQPVLYFRFDQGFEQLKTVFPEKLNNLYGCTFTVSGRNVGPFFDLLGDKDNPKPVGAWENLSGVEGLLIRELASVLNFTLKLVPFPQGRSYYENFTYYGCFLDVKNGKADVAIGGFSGSDPSRKLFSQSYVYHSSPFVYLVRARELSSMDRLARPFSHGVWILLFGIFIACSSFVLVLRFLKLTTRQYVYGIENEAPALNFFAILLGYSVCRTPRQIFARYLLLLLLLLTLVIRNAYQGSLYDAIRRDGFVRIPSGLREIIKWNYKILVSPEISKMNALPKDLTIIIPHGGYLARIKIIETIDGRFGTAVLRESFIHNMEKTKWRRNDMSLINEVIIMYHFVMYFPKQSIYLATFNKKLQALTDAGITNKLKFNITSESVLRSMEKRRPAKEALSYRSLKAIYDIYIAMKIVSMIVFCLELISVRFDRLHQAFQKIG